MAPHLGGTLIKTLDKAKFPDHPFYKKSFEEVTDYLHQRLLALEVEVKAKYPRCNHPYSATLEGGEPEPPTTKDPSDKPLQLKHDVLSNRYDNLFSRYKNLVSEKEDLQAEVWRLRKENGALSQKLTKLDGMANTFATKYAEMVCK